MQVAIERPLVEDRILEDVEARLLARGYRAMRVDALARDLAISKRTLYEQFSSKQDMARAAVERRYDRLLETIAGIRAAKLDPIAAVREVAVAIGESEAGLSPAFTCELESTPWLADAVQAGRARAHAQLDALIEAGSRAGRLRRGLDVRLARRALLASIDAACRPAALAEDGRARSRAPGQAADLVLAGLSL